MSRDFTHHLSNSKSMKPDFLIIGSQKCGTSSLLYYLGQHTEIAIPNIKEIHFFDVKYHKGIEWYENQFPDKTDVAKITGEATPYYLFHPLVPQRVALHYPEIKIIVLLRNPINRAYSHYWMIKNRGQESQQTFEKAIEAEAERVEPEIVKILKNPEYRSKSHQHHSYLSRGKYFEQLQNWFLYFPITNFHFIKTENLLVKPISELEKLYSFLGIKYTDQINLSLQRTSKYPSMKPETRKILNNFFRLHNEKLKTIIGDEFTW